MMRPGINLISLIAGRAARRAVQDKAELLRDARDRLILAEAKIATLESKGQTLKDRVDALEAAVASHHP